MRSLLLLVVFITGCAAIAPTCTTDAARPCSGPCNATQACSGGAWGACRPNCPAGTTCDGTSCVTGCSGATCDAGVQCTAASCPNGCCTGSTCKAPSPDTCGIGGAVCMTCDSSRADRCTAGGCACGATSACSAGQSCVSGACVTGCGAGPACSAGQRCAAGLCVCDATSCPTGCCDGATCRAPSTSACGVGGAACAACDSARANLCQSGACRCGASPACGSNQQCTANGTSATTGVGFDDQQDRLVVPSSAWPTSTTSWTFAAWVRLSADRNTFSAFFTLEQPAGHSVEYNELITASDGTTLVLWDHRDQVAVTLGAMTVGTWYFAAVAVGANGAATTWFAPAGGALTRATGTVAVVDHVEMSYLGASNFAATEFIDGSMAMARLWNGVLSDADIAAEFASATPARTSGLLGDWRLSSPSTVTADSSGLSHALLKDPGSTHTAIAGPTLSSGVFTCSP